jgi:hypothetical protein
VPRQPPPPPPSTHPSVHSTQPPPKKTPGENEAQTHLTLLQDPRLQPAQATQPAPSPFRQHSLLEDQPRRPHRSVGPVERAGDDVA